MEQTNPHGGNANKDTNGLRQYPTARGKVQDVHIVQGKEQYPEKQTYKHFTHDRAKLWDNEKNNEPITSIRPFSHAKYWWKCELGHSYFMAVSKAIYQNCPICIGKQVLIGFNDLATTHPHLAKEYDPSNPLPVTAITAGMGKRVLWTCSEGHQWKVMVYTRSKAGCPVCAIDSSSHF